MSRYMRYAVPKKGERENMSVMNERIRRSIRVSLAERDMTQADLARAIGMKPQYVSELLTGKAGKIPTAWTRVLDELGLELVAVKKGKTA